MDRKQFLYQVKAPTLQKGPLFTNSHHCCRTLASIHNSLQTKWQQLLNFSTHYIGTLSKLICLDPQSLLLHLDSCWCSQVRCILAIFMPFLWWAIFSSSFCSTWCQKMLSFLYTQWWAHSATACSQCSLWGLPAYSPPCVTPMALSWVLDFLDGAHIRLLLMYKFYLKLEKVTENCWLHIRFTYIM